MRQIRLLSAMGLLLAAAIPVVQADWSPEILLWRNPPNQPPSYQGNTDQFLAVDHREHVHMVYCIRTPIGGWSRRHLQYVQFDDHGHMLASQSVVNDSLDKGAAQPILRFFGGDSLWVMWYPGFDGIESFRYRALDLDGSFLGHFQSWPQPACGLSGFPYVFDVLSDRTAVVAAGTHANDQDQIRLFVRKPDGTVLQNDLVIWERYLCDQIYGFIDRTDSLQLVWRQVWDWQAVFGKRVAVGGLFDVSEIDDYVAITPAEPGLCNLPGYVLPVNDSLLVVGVSGYGGDTTTSGFFLHLLRRDDYSHLTVVRAGLTPRDCYPSIAVEPDGSVSTLVVDDNQDDVFLRRFSVPSLTLVENTLLMSGRLPRTKVNPQSYCVSPAGVRHLLYASESSWPDDSGSTYKLYYRFWRADLAAENRPNRAVVSEEFRLSPNPVNGLLWISGPVERIQSIGVYDILGREVSTRTVSQSGPSGGRIALDLREQPAGIYLVQLRTAGKMVTRKAVVIK